VFVDVAEQPLVFVTVTLKFPAFETVIDSVVAPVDQTFPEAEGDVKVIEFPEQIFVDPLDVMVGVGGVSTTIVTSSEQLAPLFVTVHV
jgi:hypothetical protein